MFAFHKRRARGFTLIEMAIVLGVAGILFGGLWRLLSNGNAQMRDQATAAQHLQVIGAVSAYLQTTEGQGILYNLGANGSTTLTLPPSASPAGSGGCAAAIPANPGLCGLLPPGFSSSTLNPYGQAYNIGVLKDATALHNYPQSYTFMVLTSGGDAISDTSGGRISASIGGDGGFIYSTTVCGATPATACGSYGAWSVATGSYFSPNPAAIGEVASRTYYSPSQSLSSNWLSRVAISGDSTYLYNTMKTPLYLGEQATYFGSSSTDTAGGTLYMQGGTLNASASTINLGTTGQIIGSANISGTAIAGGTITLVGNTGTSGNALVTLNGNCTTYTGATCNYTMAINTGDLNVGGQISTLGLNSNTFVYTGSDIRLKTNIKPLADPLAAVMKLNPVSFDYKANGRPGMGVIAQELEKIYPQLVGTQPQGMKAVNYDGLIAPLIGAVQELKRENEDLRAQLKAQDAHQQKLDEELQSLRK